MKAVRSKRATRHWLSWLVTFISLYALYLLFASKLSVVELVAALGAALVSTVAAGILGTVGTARFGPALREVLEAWRIPGNSVKGSWELLKALAAQLFSAAGAQSLIRSVHFDVGGDDERSAGRRALALLYTTMTPNFIVLGLVPNQQLLLFHQILPGKVLKMTRKLGAKP